MIVADLTITRTELRLRGHDQPIAILDEPRSRGFDGRYKRSTPNDLFIVPLGEKARPSAGVYLIDVEPTTPYRVVIEVVFTLAQSKIDRWTLRSSTDPARALQTRAPLTGALLVEGLNLSVFVVNDGISLKTSGGNIAAGCTDVGPGLAIPKVGGRHDLGALASCLAKLKHEYPSETVLRLVANPDAEFDTLVGVAQAAVGGEATPLFPDIVFAIPR